MNKKLIYILNQYSDKEGSHFFHVINLLEEIASNNVNITLVIEKATAKPQFNSNNIKVVLQTKRGVLRFFELFRIVQKLNKQGYKKVFIRISQWGAIPAILVSKISNLETYFWHSGTTHRLDNNRKINSNYFRWLITSSLPFNFVKNNTSYFVSGPETMLDYYNQEVGVKKEKLVCLYNDINLKRFTVLDSRSRKILKLKSGFQENEKIILFVHRFSPVRKSLFYMPYILTDVLEDKNNKCVVIGGGPELEEFKIQVEEMGLSSQVSILGEVPNSKIQDYYSISDIFINPTYTEGFPRVLIEAMASGLPIVTTNAGGIKDILGPKQLNYMTDILDRDKFKELLNSLLNDDESCNNLISENLEHVKKYSTPNVAKMYIENLFKND
jgi:glycosyltransferase involved in cell wall biosynthesis|tara:strand:- start:1 stop:1152 length:1152 start_codon:yes stop_codon:yes gene_type:complete